MNTESSGARWCCKSLELAWRDAGQKGFSVVMQQMPYGAFFYLQCRNFDTAEQIDSIPPQGLSAGWQTGLTFCPWCGQDLAAFYSQQLDVLARPDLLFGEPKD